jgi:hypothetical protein
MLPTTLVVPLPDMPFLADHAISGKAIVPAVELLDLLLRVLDQQGVRLHQPLTLRDVSFPRFLPADDLPRCSFEVALAEAGDGGAHATFSSRIALPGGMQRLRVHAQATFGRDLPDRAAGLAPVSHPASAPPRQSCVEYQVAAERVYRELVRFGPRFCNLRGSLALAPDAAWATVESPTPPHPASSPAGCPYLIDSAMQLACVWGQRYAGVVAYPTELSSRTIFAPIAHGKRRATVVPRSVEPRRLIFDLWLTDQDHRVCDAVVGLVMVSPAAGPTPPAWIVA